MPPRHPFTLNTAKKRNSEIQVWGSFSCAKLELNMVVKMLLLDANFQIPGPFLCHFFKKKLLVNIDDDSNFFAQVQLPIVVKACFHGAKTFPPHREALMKSANPFWQKSWKHIQVCNILRG